ncbi:MAG: hypothetical protein ABJP34_00500 [Erythrobacter sp.]
MRSPFLTLLAGALGLALLPSAAQAGTVEELAREAVLELCSDLMELETPLAEAKSIKDRGYEAKGSRNHPRFGRLDIVQKKTEDGMVWIANSRTASLCQVGMSGAGAKKAFDRLLADPQLLDQALLTDKDASSNNNGVTIKTMRTPTLDEVFYGVQFVDTSSLGKDAPLLIQQYLLGEE